MMKLGFSTLGSPNWTLEQIAEGASRYGFDGVELRMVRGQVNLQALQELAPERLENAHRLFRDAGLEVFCVDTSLRLGTLVGENRQGQLEEAEALFTISQGLKAPYARIFAGEIEDKTPTQSDLPLFRDQLSALSELAQKYGVEILLETHDTFSTGESISKLFASGETSITAGVLWDVLHSYRHGETFDQTLRLIGNRIALVHIKDSKEFSPDSFDLKLIGDGIVPISDAVRRLKAFGYDGYLSFEWEKGWHPELEGPEVALPQYIQAMQKILSEAPTNS